jgi:3'(2'), 5'-bisphosphate nucleotidase
MEITENLIITALQTAFRAGKAILEVYSQPFDIEFKSDNSPLTIADKKAHSIISEGLSGTALPLLSEEGAQINYEIRKNWDHFWLIDPLDGTKEFIKKNGDFTVNIALISHQQPAFGVVYAPVPGFIYWGSKSGSYRLNISLLKGNEPEDYQKILTLAEKLPCIVRPEGFIVLGSRSHLNNETESYIKGLQAIHTDLSFVSRGSSLKFCTLAEGGADVYPRFGPTMEWDTAAGQAVAIFAGCTVKQAENGLPVAYNKPSLLNPFFIAECKKK